MERSSEELLAEATAIMARVKQMERVNGVFIENGQIRSDEEVDALMKRMHDTLDEYYTRKQYLMPSAGQILQ